MFEEQLRQIESENNINILYCCEAGSRAWGFPSPDSDYDIRFVYVHPLEWYVRLKPERDTMEWFSEDRALDFSGWELRKTLNLFAVCNPAFNEQLGSPIIYRENAPFALAVRRLISTYFQPIRAYHHYYSIASKMSAEHPFARPIGVKAYFYIIRPLLACRFILKYQTQPPTAFADLTEKLDLPKNICFLLNDLIEQKRTTNERTSIAVHKELIDYTSHLLEEITDIRANRLNDFLPTPEPAVHKPLEMLFQQWTLRTNGTNAETN